MRRHGSAVDLFQHFFVHLFAIALLMFGTAKAADSPRGTSAPSSGEKAAANAVPRSSVGAPAAQRLALLPLAFEANQGQSDARVKFLARGPGYVLFLSPQETVLSLSQGKQSQTLRLSFVGANHAPEILGAELLALKSNYYLGNDPGKWRRNVANYGRVIYRSMYPGVDVAYYGNQGQLENDLLLAAGADASRIALRVEGAQQVKTDISGNVVLTTTVGDVRLLKPHAYQDVNGTRKEIAATYRVANDRVSFVLGEYDRDLPLVIDPVIDYSTYVSTSAALSVSGIAADGSLNAWVSGVTKAVSFADATGNNTTNAGGSTDVFVLKLNANGTGAELAIFIGGSGAETSTGIAADALGNIYVAGSTASTDFPEPGGNFVAAQKDSGTGASDAFLAKLDSSGTLLYSTYLGGSGADVANAIAVIGPNAALTTTTPVGPYAFLAGSTSSSTATFPFTTNAYAKTLSAGGTDAFVAAINTNVATGITAASCDNAGNATLTFSAAHGFAIGDVISVKGVATAGGGGRTKFDITSTPAAPVIISGVTLTAPFTITYHTPDAGCNAHSDSNTGTTGSVTGGLQYASYLGGAGGASGANGIAATALNSVFITGQTKSAAFPTRNAAQGTCGGTAAECNANGDAFVAKFDATQIAANSDLSLVYSTYLGGSGADAGNAITVGPSGSAYVTGSATGTGICGTSCSLQAGAGGGLDAFALKLDAAGARVWSAVLGGSGNEQGNAIQLDTRAMNTTGNGTPAPNVVYMAGSVQSDMFGTQPAGTVIGSLHGSQDGFLAVITGAGGTTPALAQGLYVGGSGNNDTVNSLALGGTGVASIAVDNQGNNDYTVTPTIRISGGGGSGATATATMNGRRVASIAVGNAGSGYRSAPTVNIIGNGTGAAAHAVLTQDASPALFAAGSTDSPDVATTATMYQPTATFLDPSAVAPGNTTGFAARLGAVYPTTTSLSGTEQLDNGTFGTQIGYCCAGAFKTPVIYTYTINNGAQPAHDVVFNWPVPRDGNKILSIVVDNPGTGYTSVPAVTITPSSPARVPTTATAVLSGDTVGSITVDTAANAGYPGTPGITIDPPPPGGTQATAHAVMSPGAPVFDLATTSTGCTKATSGAGVTCQWANVAGSGTESVVITATPTADLEVISGTKTIAASPMVGAANGNLFKITPGNLTAVPVTDLQITQDAAAPATLKVGDTISFTVHLKNANTEGINAPSVVVTDTLPAGFTVDTVATTGTGCSKDTTNAGSTPPVVTCTATNLAGNATADLTVVGSFPAATSLCAPPSCVGPTGTKSFDNAAAITSYSNLLDKDTSDASNKSTASVTVNRPVTLTATSSTTAASPVNLGDPVTYKVTVTNTHATLDAPGFNLTPLLPTSPKFTASGPPTITFLTGVNPGPGTPAALPAGCSDSGCSNATLPANSSIEYDFPGTYADTDGLDVATPSAPVDWQPSISADVTPAVIAPAKVTITVQRSATVAMTADGTPGTVAKFGDATNNPVTYTLTVTNATASANTATDINVTPNLPAGFTASSATATLSCHDSGGGCTVKAGSSKVGCIEVVGGALGCSGAKLGPNDILTYVIVGAYAETALTDDTADHLTVSFTPSVAAAVLPAPTQPAAAVSTTINRAADLSLVVTGSPTPVNMGDTLTYSITLSNSAGSNTATNVVLTNAKPTGFTLLSLNPTSVSVTGAGQATPTCETDGSGCATPFAIKPGASVTYHVKGYFADGTSLVPAGTDHATAPVDTAGVTAATIGTKPTGVTTQSPITVQRSATLTLAITPAVTTKNLDSDVTYTLTLANTAGNTAIDVDLITSDLAKGGILPAGFHPSAAIATASANATLAACDQTATATHCTVTLPAGENLQYAITGKFLSTDPAALDFVQPSLLKTLVANLSAPSLSAGSTLPSAADKTNANVTVQRKATLSLGLAGPAGQQKLGDAVTYQITLSSSNDPALSPNTATDVRITNTLPPGFQVSLDATNKPMVTVTGVDPALCDLTTAAAGCPGAAVAPGNSNISLAPGASIVYSITGTYPDPTGLAANVSSDNTNKFGTAGSTAAVAPSAILSSTTAPITNVIRTATLTLNIDPAVPTTTNLDNAAAGFPNSFIYTLKLRNTAGNTATNVSLTPTGGLNASLPNGFHPTSAAATTTGVGTLKGTCVEGATTTATGCTGATIPVNGEIDYAITGTFPQSVLGTGSTTGGNTLTAAADAAIVDLPKPTSSNSNVTVQRTADVSLGLTSNTNVPLKGTLALTTTVQDLGPDDAPQTRITYTFPVGSQYTYKPAGSTISTYGGSCSPLTATNVITCTLDLTVNQGSISFTVNVTPDPTAITSGTEAVVTVTGETSGPITDSVTSNNKKTITPILQRQADLSVTLTDNTATTPVAQGGNLELTAIVHNAGADDAPNVQVVYTLPTTNYTKVSNTFPNNATNCGLTVVGSTNTFTCLVGPVSANTNSAAYKLVVTADPAAVVAGSNKGIVHPSAKVDDVADLVDSNASNDTSPLINTTVARMADLKIVSQVDDTTSTTNPAPLKTGSTIQYTTTITNAALSGSQNDATGVQVTYTLPSGFTFSSNPATNNLYTACDATNLPKVVCDVPDALVTKLSGNQAFTIIIGVDPNTTVTGTSKTVATTVDIASGQVYDNGTGGLPADPGNGAPTGNNYASTSSYVARKADLVMEALTSNGSALDPIPLNGSVVLTATLHNGGPSDATGVVVKYSLPDQNYAFDVNSIAGSGFASCDAQIGQFVTCHVADAKVTSAGVTQTFQVSVKPSASAISTAPAGSVANGTAFITPQFSAEVSSASVWDNGLDGSSNPNGSAGSNNTQATNPNPTIARRANLQIVTSPPAAAYDNGPVGDAGPQIYSTTVTNIGPDSAPNIKMRYTLPAGSTLWTTTPAPDYASCDSSALPVVVCSFPSDLAPGFSATHTLKVKPATLATSQTIVQTTELAFSNNVWDDGASGNAGANNNLTFNTTVQHNVHLGIALASDSPQPAYVNLNAPVKYTITVSNAASTTLGSLTSAASGVKVTLNVPAGFTNMAQATGTAAGWTCTFDPPNNVNPAPPYECTQANDIGAFDAATGGYPGSSKLVISGQYSDNPVTLLDLTGGQGTRSFGASALATLSTDPDNPTGVTSAPVLINLQRLVDLSAAAASNPAQNGAGSPANLGSPVVYTVSVANAGPNRASTVGVNLVFPTNFDLVSATGTGWSCGAYSSGQMHCDQSGDIGATLATPDLVVTGSYSDVTSNLSAGAGKGTMQVTATPATTKSYQATAPAAAAANTDIQRLVALVVSAHTGIVSQTTLAAPVEYDITVKNNLTDVNSVATNTAMGVTLTETFPAPVNGDVVTFIPSTTGWTCSPATHCSYNGWTCDFANNSATCSYNSPIGSNQTSALLPIKGSYSNDVTGTHIATGQTSMAPIAAVNSTASVGVLPASNTLQTPTTIFRNAGVTLSIGATPSSNVGLNDPVTFTVTADNTIGPNDADTVTVKATVPYGFDVPTQGPTFASPWSCTGISNLDPTTHMCSVPTQAFPTSVCSATCTANIASGSKPSFTIVGKFDGSVPLSGGQGNSAASAQIDQTVPMWTNNSKLPQVVSSAVGVVRKVALTIATPVATPNPVGAPGDSVTYTLTASNGGPDDVVDPVVVQFNVPTGFTVTQPSSTTPSVQCRQTVGSTTTTFTCNCQLGSVVKCTIPTPSFGASAPANSSTQFDIVGNFSASLINAIGIGNSSATVSVSSTNITNDVNAKTSDSASSTVVDTPKGTAVTPQLSSNGQPLTVTYDNVTKAGFTAERASTSVPTVPAGLTFPAPPALLASYDSTTPSYFLVNSAQDDGNYPVVYGNQNGNKVTVCVAYGTLPALLGVPAFVKADRLQIFDNSWNRLTTSLDQTQICGVTTNVSPGLFTVREPVNHLPVPKATSVPDPLTPRGLAASKYSLSAKGTVDADFKQLCVSNANGCSDNLYFQWTINGDATKVALKGPQAPDADGTYNPPDTDFLQFNLGTNDVMLTVTDYDPRKAAPANSHAVSTTIKVQVNSAVLSSDTPAAVISAGQPASFRVQLPQMGATDWMSLTCDGVRTTPNDGMTLAQAHITCAVSPNPASANQFYATVTITTSGTTFSKAAPQRPGSSRGVLAMWFGFATMPVFGMLLLPGTRRGNRKWILLMLLGGLLAAMVACGGGGGALPAAQQAVPPFTPSGTYTITVSGTVAGQSTATLTPAFTLTVR